MADLSLLDLSVVKLLEAAADLSPEDLTELIEAELAGKTRASAVAGLSDLLPPEDEAEELPDESALDELADLGQSFDAAEIPSGERVENIIPNTELHFGDGRSIKFGEADYVSSELAAELRERGQAK